MNRRAKILTGVTGLALAGAAFTPMVASAHQGSVAPVGTPEAAAQARPGTLALPAPQGLRLVHTVRGDGVQVYECIANAGGSGTWRNRPVATLTDRRGTRPVGTHDSVTRQGQPPVPQWSYLDGARVVAQLPPQLNQADPEPTRNIAALRLGVAENSGVGRLARVTVIQRDLVTGGVGPAGACTPGTDQAVVSEYVARYTFWAPPTA